jgi:hypothetical protein
MHFRLPLVVLALTISAFAQERPPQILEVYREFWKPKRSRPAGRLKWRLLRSWSISSAHILLGT